jgi:hypothetical protein
MAGDVRGHAAFDCAVCPCVLHLACGVAAVVLVSFVELSSTAGLVVIDVVLVVTLAPVALVPLVDTVVSSVVAATVLAKFCSSWIVVQVVISLPKGVVIVADAMAKVWLTITGIA